MRNWAELDRVVRHQMAHIRAALEGGDPRVFEVLIADLGPDHKKAPEEEKLRLARLVATSFAEKWERDLGLVGGHVRQGTVTEADLLLLFDLAMALGSLMREIPPSHREYKGLTGLRADADRRRAAAGRREAKRQAAEAAVAEARQAVGDGPAKAVTLTAAEELGVDRSTVYRRLKAMPPRRPAK